ncbi:MAG: cyclophilin-like fold protein [Candidatus Hydrothermarchaeota archaeon]
MAIPEKLKEADKILYVEMAFGVLLLFFAIYGIVNAFDYFASAWMGHMGDRLVSRSEIIPFWRSALASCVRMVIVAFIGGVLTAHSAIGIFGEERLYGPIASAMEQITSKERSGKIKISDGISFITAKLHRKNAPRTVNALLNKLPLSVEKVEVYNDNVLLLNFELDVEGENQRITIKNGEIGYIPELKQICIAINEERMISPVNIIGKVEEGDASALQIDRGLSIKTSMVE